MRFRQIRGVKRSVFGEYAEWNGAFSVKTRYSGKSGFVLGFNTYLNKIFEILCLGLVYYWTMPKNCEKTNYKISCMCTFRFWKAVNGWRLTPLNFDLTMPRRLARVLSLACSSASYKKSIGLQTLSDIFINHKIMHSVLRTTFVTQTV
jgi:hypothetical protein